MKPAKIYKGFGFEVDPKWVLQRAVDFVGITIFFGFVWFLAVIS